MLKLTDVVKNLLIINVLMFIAGMVLESFGPQYSNMLALHYPGAEDVFQPYQIATHFFMHANLPHIFFNMFALVMFGSVLETLWGPKKFLFYYFFCAIGAAALHMLIFHIGVVELKSLRTAFLASPELATFIGFFEEVPSYILNYGPYKTLYNQLQAGFNEGVLVPGLVEGTEQLMNRCLQAKMAVPMVGASGAIFGLLLAFGMKFPNQELMLIFLPIPIKAKYFIPVLMGIELFLGVEQFEWDNIAHFAHLGGALAGFLLIIYWQRFGSRF